LTVYYILYRQVLSGGGGVRTPCTPSLDPPLQPVRDNVERHTENINVLDVYPVVHSRLELSVRNTTYRHTTCRSKKTKHTSSGKTKQTNTRLGSSFSFRQLMMNIFKHLILFLIFSPDVFSSQTNVHDISQKKVTKLVYFLSVFLNTTVFLSYTYFKKGCHSDRVVIAIGLS
jgi:hypothetical protein